MYTESGNSGRLVVRRSRSKVFANQNGCWSSTGDRPTGAEMTSA